MTKLYILINEDGEYSDYYKKILGCYSVLVSAQEKLKFLCKNKNTCENMYIQETELDHEFDHDSYIYMLCEGHFIRYKNVNQYDNPYYPGSLKDFFNPDKTLDIYKRTYLLPDISYKN